MRVVLVRLSALGDVVHAWPLALALRASRPDLHLTWVVEAPLAPLVDGHPAVDALITTSTRRWRRQPFAGATRVELAGLRARLTELAPELVIDAQGTVKSALVVRATRAPERVGLARPWRRERLAGLAYTTTIAGRRDHPHVVASTLELVRAVGATPPAPIPAPDGRWLLTRPHAPATAPAPPAGGALLLPGAGAADKVLPIATLAAVARDLAARGLTVTIVWGPGERERAAAIAELTGGVAAVAPPTDIPALARLLAAAAVVVGADTGPIHLAASLGTPTVAVFLTTDWRRNGPLGDRVQVVTGAAPVTDSPTGSARARRIRSPHSGEISAAAVRLLDG